MVGAFKQAQWGAAAYDQELSNWRKRSATAHEEGRDAAIALSSPSGAWRVPPQERGLQDRGVTYFRGALVLNRLRAELGEAAFWRGISNYLTNRDGKGARTSDLRRSLEATSQRDLSETFSISGSTPRRPTRERAARADESHAGTVAAFWLK